MKIIHRSCIHVKNIIVHVCYWGFGTSVHDLHDHEFLLCFVYARASAGQEGEDIWSCCTTKRAKLTTVESQACKDQWALRSFIDMRS